MSEVQLMADILKLKAERDALVKQNQQNLLALEAEQKENTALVKRNQELMDLAYYSGPEDEDGNLIEGHMTWQARAEELRTQLAEANATIQGLREALEKYGRHYARCQWFTNVSSEKERGGYIAEQKHCDCGYSAALSSIGSAIPSPTVCSDPLHLVAYKYVQLLANDADVDTLHTEWAKLQTALASHANAVAKPPAGDEVYMFLFSSLQEFRDKLNSEKGKAGANTKITMPLWAFEALLDLAEFEAGEVG